MSEIIDNNLDLVHSPDDGGYYFQDQNWRVSKIYRTKKGALESYRNGNIEWEEVNE